MITTTLLALVSALLLMLGDTQTHVVLGIIILILAGVQAGCIIIGHST